MHLTRTGRNGRLPDSRSYALPEKPTLWKSWALKTSISLRCGSSTWESDVPKPAWPSPRLSMAPQPSPRPQSHQLPDTCARPTAAMGRRELSGAVTGSRLIIRFISLRLPGHNTGGWRMLMLPARALGLVTYFYFLRSIVSGRYTY